MLNVFGECNVVELKIAIFFVTLIAIFTGCFYFEYNDDITIAIKSSRIFNCVTTVYILFGFLRITLLTLLIGLQNHYNFCMHSLYNTAAALHNMRIQKLLQQLTETKQNLHEFFYKFHHLQTVQ